MDRLVVVAAAAVAAALFHAPFLSLLISAVGPSFSQVFTRPFTAGGKGRKEKERQGLLLHARSSWKELRKIKPYLPSHQ